jgi:excinuclease ABC subunit A
MTSGLFCHAKRRREIEMNPEMERSIMNQNINIRGARLHNLKNVSLSIPKNKLVVFTGLSGSGKSTMAFDTLHMEGQRQFMESLGLVTYTSKPPLDGISGLSPSISVDQRITNHSPRSTVGTATEVFTYLRVLYARVGHRPCPRCGGDIAPAHEDTSETHWDDDEGLNGDSLDLSSVACPHCGAPVPEMNMAMFSFNKPAGACPTCTGLGTIYSPNLDKLIDEEKSIVDIPVSGWDIHTARRTADTLRAAGQYYGFDFDPTIPVKQLGHIQRTLLLYGVYSPQFRRHFPNIQPPTTVAKGNFEGVVTNLLRRHAEHASDADYLEKIERFLSRRTCPDCGGARLRPEARAVTVTGRPLVAGPGGDQDAVSNLPLTDLAQWIGSLQTKLSAEDWLIAEPIIEDLHERVRRLVEVGLGYLTLERSTPTLSAGEAQRMRLASLLGSGLTGVLYVLDEPTIGLHARDTERLVNILRALRDLGNTVLIIEHDLSVIEAADWVVDFGPGAGRLGGQVVAQGTPDAIRSVPASLTGQYLAGTAKIRPPAKRRRTNGPGLIIHGAREHNLKNIHVHFPLGSGNGGPGALVAVTGVSGSGKSSLMFDILDRAARRRFYNSTDIPGEYDSITGWEYLDKIITIDQSAIGRSTRSNAATYTDAFTPIREAFAALPEARERGFTAQHFSFNVPGGRCERCEGAGVLSVEMHFLPNVEVRCPACHGRRYKREVLAVKYQGKDISQVLEMTIADALPLFEHIPAVKARLGLMVEVGLGYLQLGQPASTFSGGEAQRVKLAKELSRRATGRTLYLLDEPTTGLHSADIAHLMLLLHRLVDAGNSIIVVEHNLDVIKCADWVIDLGPEGGAAGGQIVAEGTPEDVAQVETSRTGRYIRQALEG